MRIDDLPF